jgi:hypothetical protein
LGAVDRGEETLETALGLGAVRGAVDLAEGLFERPGRSALALEQRAEPASPASCQPLAGLEQAVAGAVEVPVASFFHVRCGARHSAGPPGLALALGPDRVERGVGARAPGGSSTTIRARSLWIAWR